MLLKNRRLARRRGTRGRIEGAESAPQGSRSGAERTSADDSDLALWGAGGEGGMDAAWPMPGTRNRKRGRSRKREQKVLQKSLGLKLA